MTTAASALFRRDRILALLGIVLVAINLRTAVGAVSPIIDLIDVDVPLSRTALSLVGAAPPLIFAVSGLIGPLVARRIGFERGMVVIVVFLVAGPLLRALAPNAAVFVVGTAVALLGAGVGNVLLPPLVKRHFPDRIGLITAVYVTIMSVGATITPVLAVPIAEASSWRSSLGIWAATAAVAAVPWILELVVRTRRVPTETSQLRAAEIAAEPALVGNLIRSSIAWATALMFAAAALGAYAMFAWLPALLVDTAGVSSAEAGVLLGVFAACGFPAALVVPVLAARLRSVRPIIVAGMMCFVVGYLGLLLVPSTLPLLWVLLVGLGPLFFPLGLALINLRTRTSGGSVALSGFVQGVGYVVGAAGPVVVGLLRDATGGWTAPLIFLMASVALSVPGLIVLGRSRFVEDELEGRLSA